MIKFKHNKLYEYTDRDGNKHGYFFVGNKKNGDHVFETKYGDAISVAVENPKVYQLDLNKFRDAQHKNNCIVWVSETVDREADADHALDYLFGFRVWDFSKEKTPICSRQFKVTVEEICTGEVEE